MAGRKRHLLVDTLGLIWGLAVLPAAPTDWDGAVEVFRRVGKAMPRLAIPRDVINTSCTSASKARSRVSHS